MKSSDIDIKRKELKALYRESFSLNRRKKELEQVLQNHEGATGHPERLARKRKCITNPLLSITDISLITGFSRDKIYRLLRDGKLKDRHPVSVGSLVREGAGFRSIPQGHLKKYKQWRSDWEALKNKRQRQSSVY